MRMHPNLVNLNEPKIKGRGERRESIKTTLVSQRVLQEYHRFGFDYKNHVQLESTVAMYTCTRKHTHRYTHTQVCSTDGMVGLRGWYQEN